MADERREGPRQALDATNTSTSILTSRSDLWCDWRLKRRVWRDLDELLGTVPPRGEIGDWKAAGMHLGIRERDLMGAGLKSARWAP